MVTIAKAKARLDLILEKARTDLYKPIQIAEVLRRSRIEGGFDIRDVETYRKRSVHWRDEVTQRFMGKGSTSSARYQHDVWNESAMPPAMLAALDTENKRTKGAVERYIYFAIANVKKRLPTFLRRSKRQRQAISVWNRFWNCSLCRKVFGGALTRRTKSSRIVCSRRLWLRLKRL